VHILLADRRRKHAVDSQSRFTIGVHLGVAYALASSAMRALVPAIAEFILHRSMIGVTRKDMSQRGQSNFDAQAVATIVRTVELLIASTFMQPPISLVLVTMESTGSSRFV